MMTTTRRKFVHSWATAMAWGTATRTLFPAADALGSGESFALYQERRRKELWSLLGDLPWQHKPATPKLLKTEKHEGYTLERLTLDLNGMEAVPALLLIPDKRQSPAPGLLYIHWHGGCMDWKRNNFCGA